METSPARNYGVITYYADATTGVCVCVRENSSRARETTNNIIATLDRRFILYYLLLLAGEYPDNLNTVFGFFFYFFITRTTRVIFLVR